MREKLIEFIRNADKEDYESRTQDEHYSYMAGRLIANGVTIPVRCKDCKYWKHFDHVGCSDLAKVCSLSNYMIGANGYCLYGERKDNE